MERITKNNRWLSVLKNEAFRKVILMLISYFLLTIFLIHTIGWSGKWLREFIYGYNWQHVYKEDILDSIKLSFFLSSFFFPFLIAGLYFGIKKGGKSLFIFPILSFVGGIVFSFVLLFLGLFWHSEAESVAYFISFFTIQSIWLAFFLLLALTFLKFQKENLFFKIIVILFLFSFFINIGISKYFNKTTNPNWCENERITAGQSNYGYTCYHQLALRSNNVQLCNKIEHDDYRTDCLADFALKLNDVKVCGAASEKFMIEKCIEEVAVRIRDSSLCPQIESEFYRSNCYLSIAVLKEDSDLCQFVSSDDKERCYGEIGIAKRDPNLCDFIEPGSYWHNQCISEIADEIKNPNLCEKIKYELPRKECYERAKD